jgi:hypothetical protein
MRRWDSQTARNMGRKEEDRCRRYREGRDRAHARMEELVDKGADALSRYDVEIAAGGDAEKALWTALYLAGNHVRHFTELIQECDRLPRQATLFEAGEHPELRAEVEKGVERMIEIARDVAPDAHLEAQYEDRQSGFEDS